MPDHYSLSLSSSDYPNLLTTFQNAVNNITDSYHWYQIKLGLDKTKKGSYNLENDAGSLLISNFRLTIEYQYGE